MNSDRAHGVSRFEAAVPAAILANSVVLGWGWHGVWCWERLTPLLQQAGHDAVAMDLPIDHNTASFDTWADVVCAAISGCGDDLVLVGHSYSGHAIPLVAAHRPVRHLVYLCAFLPEIGRSFADQLRAEPEQLNPAIFKGLEFDGQSRAVWADVGLAQALMYADCDESTAQAAIKRLRPQAAGGFALPFSLTEFPSVALHLHHLQRSSDHWRRVVEANRPRPAGRGPRGTSRQSFTVPFTTVGSC